MIKICKTHGETIFILEGRGYLRCKQCRVDSVSKRRRKVKEMAVEYKGGCCSNCGYNKSITALDFHHINGKDFGIAKYGHSRSWARTKIELDKCVLLCANCHREHHESEFKKV